MACAIDCVSHCASQGGNMGSQPDRIDLVFSILRQMSEAGRRIPRPVQAVVTRSGLANPIVRKHLRQLAVEGKVSLEESVNGRGAHIVTCTVITATPALIATEAPPPAPAPTNTSETPTSPPAPAPVPSTPPWEVVVLVDFDNLDMGAKQFGYRFSCDRIKNFARQHGIVRFAYVFLPPANTHADIIVRWWRNGFTVVACPMGKKDKDAVDAKLSEMARNHLDSGAHTIVIVSDDYDFQPLEHYAADRGKKVVFLSPRRHKSLIADDTNRDENERHPVILRPAELGDKQVLYQGPTDPNRESGRNDHHRGGPENGNGSRRPEPALPTLQRSAERVQSPPASAQPSGTNGANGSHRKEPPPAKKKVLKNRDPELIAKFCETIRRFDGTLRPTSDGGSFDSFIADIAVTLRERELAPGSRPFSFNRLLQYIESHLRKRWQTVFSFEDTAHALTAFVRESVLIRTHLTLTEGKDAGTKVMVYSLDRTHRLITQAQPALQTTTH
ncbi:MAG: NYN domain-containing protein [bacterium]|nr:NYN domain-containing protein [bacterium]